MPNSTQRARSHRRPLQTYSIDQTKKTWAHRQDPLRRTADPKPARATGCPSTTGAGDGAGRQRAGCTLEPTAMQPTSPNPVSANRREGAVWSLGGRFVTAL